MLDKRDRGSVDRWSRAPGGRKATFEIGWAWAKAWGSHMYTAIWRFINVRNVSLLRRRKIPTTGNVSCGAGASETASTTGATRLGTALDVRGVVGAEPRPRSTATAGTRRSRETDAREAISGAWSIHSGLGSERQIYDRQGTEEGGVHRVLNARAS